ncbi:ADP-dependent glucokinase/phosphofructokinase [Methanolobus halotolerans]|uniref:ADP-dependent glucokinase n=1 Tax=Methanolobus halotolerans TaxID=2052935 RepID=A0A4E0QY15_9EURY|nr:ADP-dependent glucokinase/phosphofructokinase [Methanolobus halotolerans]TGC08450.1 ADP-dependent glucokinase [Methanolobus halotolerans]
MKILCGYNANIDAIYKVDGSQMAEMAESYREEISEKIKDPPGFISSIPDFFAGLFTSMEKGTGAEWMVRDKEVSRWLRNNFLEGSLLRMGGNMGIMANVLSELGASRVIPNVANPSELQMSFFSRKAIFIPDGGEIQIDGSGGAFSTFESDENELIHFVFDFKKGEKFRFIENIISVPRENRFIATYDPLNFELHIDEQFSRYALEHIGEMDGALISGYHLLRERYPDGSSYVEKLNRSLDQLKEWKVLNNKLYIHVEFGHFSSDKMAYDVFNSLFPLVDSIGINEDELAMLAHMSELDTSGILEMDAEAILETAVSLCEVSGPGRVQIHTREFVLSVASDMHLGAEHILETLHFGVNCAAAFACSGKLDERENLLKIASSIGRSKYGKEQVQNIADQIPSGDDGITREDSIFRKYREHFICAVPTRLCGDPVATVGLGDTISSAIFLRELELRA